MNFGLLLVTRSTVGAASASPPPHFAVVDRDYRDPVGGAFAGRWLAAFAPVGNTPLVVIVQTRVEDATALDRLAARRLVWLGASGLVVVFALLGLATWAAGRRRREAFGTVPGVLERAGLCCTHGGAWVDFPGARADPTVPYNPSHKETAMPIIRDEGKRKEIIDLLTRGYWMELETVQNYIANSVNLDGVRAEEIKKSLSADITDEVAHAQQFAARIKELYGLVPGSFAFKPEQKMLQPPPDTTDVAAVIRGVIEAEQGAIDHYVRIIKACDGVDYVTQDMVTTIMKDEEAHLRQFEGFLKEYEKR